MTGNECLGDGTSKCQISRVKFDRLFMNSRRRGASDERMTELFYEFTGKLEFKFEFIGKFEFIIQQINFNIYLIF